MNVSVSVHLSVDVYVNICVQVPMEAKLEHQINLSLLQVCVSMVLNNLYPDVWLSREVFSRSLFLLIDFFFIKLILHHTAQSTGTVIF